MLFSSFAIALGATLGALLRWGLGVWLNGLQPHLPPGTLLANLVGGYLIGVAVAFFAQHPEALPAWRLFIITGLLGGLTTSSTFSVEVAHDLTAVHVGGALGTAAAHLLSSVPMALLDMATVAIARNTAG